MATEGSSFEKRLFKALVPIAGILLVVIIGLTVVRSRLTQENNAEAPPAGVAAELRVGGTLPDFTLHKFPGGGELNASAINAKVVLVNFWATWCEACVTEMPSIVKLRQSFKGQGFEVVAVDMDENPETVMPRALKSFKIDFPVYVDADSKLSETFDVRAIPFTVVMDHARKILFLEAGGRDWSSPDMQSMLKSWLGLTPTRNEG